MNTNHEISITEEQRRTLLQALDLFIEQSQSIAQIQAQLLKARLYALNNHIPVYNVTQQQEESDDAFIKRVTTEQAHRDAARDLEALGRKNSGFSKARGAL